MNTSISLKKNFKKFFHSTIDSPRNLWVFSKTLPFIGGLVASYTFVEISVVFILMDYLTDSRGNDQRIAAVVTNLQDVLSSILFIFVSSISKEYTGCFTMITFCAAASIEGLMLLWTSISASTDIVVYAGIFLLALGKSGQKLSENFYKYQLQEKIKEKKEHDHEGTVLTNIWLFAPSILGYIITAYITIEVHESYDQSFRFGAILMGGTYMFFLFGCKWYRLEKLSDESNLRMIFRICKAAFGKRDLKYPPSPNFYYWKDHKHNKNHDLYKHGKGLRLSPRVPRFFRWLDKAAIVKAEEEMSPETQEKNGKLCTVKEVREVKSLVPMIYLGFTFSAYGLLVATGNVFFLTQASGSMESNITTNGNDIGILFLIKEGVKLISPFIFFIISFPFRCFLRNFKANDGRKPKGNAATIVRIGFGMVCAVICSLVAWHMEVPGKNTTVALIPQFSLLGMTEGLVEGGLASLFHGQVANSMWSFEDSFTELVIGCGKLLIIPFLFSSWFNETDGRLGSYYLMLGILNGVFLLAFAYYSIRYTYKEECPEDEKISEEQPLENVHPSDSHDSRAEDINEALSVEEEDPLGNKSSFLSFPLY
ncbi:Protein NRT1/ PTR FAMILY 5.7 [Glycine soja]